MRAAEERIRHALDIAKRYNVDGAHHKAWLIDQMVRALTDCPIVKREAIDCHGEKYTYEAQGESDDYHRFVADYKAGPEGPDSYEWDEGIAP